MEQISHYISTYGSGFEDEIYIPNEVLEVPNLKLKQMSEERTPEANLRRRQLRQKEKQVEAPSTEKRIHRVTKLFDRVETLLNH